MTKQAGAVLILMLATVSATRIDAADAKRGNPLRNRIKPQSQLTIFDADGRRVAPVLSVGAFQGPPVVAFRIDGYLVVATVDDQTFHGTLHAIYFESEDCSGQPYTGVPGNHSVVPSTAIWDGEVFVTDPREAPRPVTIQSDFTTWSGGCQDRTGEPLELEALPLHFLADLGEAFRAPFRLR